MHFSTCKPEIILTGKSSLRGNHSLMAYRLRIMVTSASLWRKTAESEKLNAVKVESTVAKIAAVAVARYAIRWMST